MRLKDYDERDGKRVWLSEQEIQRLLDATPANEPRQDAALILAARCGLRRQEIVSVERKDIIESTDIGDVIRVWEGKGDKYREVPAPVGFKNLVRGMGIDQAEAVAGVDPSTIYDWVARARERVHGDTGDEGWLFVGPHDLRRSWGVRLLEAGVLPSVVMEWGGWEDWETFRNHYLAEFSPEALRRERGKVSWLAEGQSNPVSGTSPQGYAAVDTGSRFRE